LMIGVALLWSCTRTNPAGSNVVPSVNTPFSPQYTLSELDSSLVYTQAANIVGEVDEVAEASGMVASVHNPGKLWTHNDGGDESILFLLDGSSANLLRKYKVLAKNEDWEDIAMSSDALTGTTHLWVADIGDNLKVRSSYSIYRIVEPFATGGDTSTLEILNPVSEYTFTYPDGPQNAETLMIDPLNGELIIVTRGEEGLVYSADPAASTTGILTFTYRGKLPVSGITGGDVSRNGNLVLLRTYSEILLWTRLPGQTVVEALGNTPELLPYNQEPQGEAICWGVNGYYTISERVGQPLPKLYHYPE
ncbi:MAG: hypothetical protein ACPF9D_10820, partial [Owenweeksia sp.]